MKSYVQVGFTAQRTLKGDFLPPVPVYIEVDYLRKSGLAECEEKPLTDISGLIFKRYKEKKIKEQIENEKNVQGRV